MTWEHKAHELRSGIEHLAACEAEGDMATVACAAFYLSDDAAPFEHAYGCAWGLGEDTGDLSLDLYWPLPMHELTGAPSEWVALFDALDSYVASTPTGQSAPTS